MKEFSAEARPVAVRLPQWRSPDTVPETARPRELWPWLTESGSLTARLRSRCDAGFGVRILRSGTAVLTADETAWTGRGHGFVREVHLCCGTTPWVYARTLAVDGGEPEARLRDLGRKPLGDWAFDQPSARRSPLEVAWLDDVAALFPDAAIANGTGGLWARRSVLSVGDQSLYISECFLHGATPWR
ncbi:MAG TPA: chorismate lyase [Gammaproteobacteria bacterium]|jgi:chorismate--pyruvate lyase|nr:chorismate lyase [Gammaproteobacteria bacterium]